MLKSIQQLIECAECNGYRRKTIGNHSMKVVGDTIKYYYHGNNVCTVNKTTNKVTYDDCGWGGHSSTTRCLNSYREYYN